MVGAMDLCLGPVPPGDSGGAGVKFELQWGRGRREKIFDPSNEKVCVCVSDHRWRTSRVVLLVRVNG